MFSVTPLRFITSSITIKRQWLTLDHLACPLTTAQKTMVDLKKATDYEKQNEIIKKIYGWGSTASKLEPLWGDSLVYNTKSPEIPVTHFINHVRMKGWVNLAASQLFWPWNFWIGSPAP